MNGRQLPHFTRPHSVCLQLHYAAQMSNGAGFQSHSPNLALEILDIFLQQPNVQVDVCDKDGRQPLLWAASAGATKAVLVSLIEIEYVLARTIRVWLCALRLHFPFSHIVYSSQMLVKAGARVESADK